MSGWPPAAGPFGRNALLIGGVALVAALVLALALIAMNARDAPDDTAQPPPGATAPPAAPDPSASAAPSPSPEPTGEPGDDGEPGSGEDSGSQDGDDSDGGKGDGSGDGDKGGGDKDGGGKDESDALPPPRLVGPKSFGGFEKFLTAFCKENGDRAAVLLEGPDGTRATGEWVCVRIVDYTPIRLDAPCREVFGEGAKARKADRRDSTSWRCYDR